MQDSDCKAGRHVKTMCVLVAMIQTVVPHRLVKMENVKKLLVTACHVEQMHNV